jgi:ribosome-associated translation inhibitor RaiA
METPLQLELHGVKSSDHVRDLIDKNLQKIEKRYGRATACRVVVRAPNAHHKNGEPFEVSVHIALPAKREINVGHTGKDERLADLDFAVNDAFKRALRQLEAIT